VDEGREVKKGTEGSLGHLGTSFFHFEHCGSQESLKVLTHITGKDKLGTTKRTTF